MPGFNSITGDESIMYADNASFDGTEREGALDADKQIWLGATAGTHVRKATIVSGAGVTITQADVIGEPGEATLTFALSGGGTGIDSILTESGAPAVVPDGTGQVTFTGGDGIDVTGNGPGNTVTFAIDDETVGQTITGDTGGALSPTAGNWNIVSTATNGIETTGAGSTLTVAMATPYADGDFEFRSAVSGATRTLSVTNTSDTASSQSTFLHSVAGTSAGDTWSQFNIGTTRSYSFGIDNSANDILKITTDGDGTVDPSSGTHIAGFTTSATVEFGPEGSGTSDTNRTVAMRRDINGGALYYADNQSTGNVAYAGFQAGSNGGDSILIASVNANYTDPEIATKAYIHAISGGGQGDLILQANTFRFAQDDGTDILANCTAAGEWTYPLNPCFLAYNSADDTGQTKGILVTVDFDTELFDRGGDFLNDVYTAPIGAIHQFCSTVEISAINTATRFEMVIITSNRNYTCFRVNPNAVIPTGSAAVSFSGGSYSDMDLNDTAFVQVVVDGGAAGYTIEGGLGTDLKTYFSGRLVQ